MGALRNDLFCRLRCPPYWCMWGWPWKVSGVCVSIGPWQLLPPPDWPCLLHRLPQGLGPPPRVRGELRPCSPGGSVGCRLCHLLLPRTSQAESASCPVSWLPFLYWAQVLGTEILLYWARLNSRGPGHLGPRLLQAPILPGLLSGPPGATLWGCVWPTSQAYPSPWPLASCAGCCSPHLSEPETWTPLPPPACFPYQGHGLPSQCCPALCILPSP